MQLIMDPETSISIEPKMAALSTETLNGKSTNSLVDELDKAIVNDNKENVNDNEDSFPSDKEETNNSSDFSFNVSQSTKGNDIIEKITNSEIENGHLSNDKSEDVLENKLAEICNETDKQSEEQPHVTEPQNSNKSIEEDSKIEDFLESISSSVVQNIQDTDSTVRNDMSVDDINCKSNEVIETPQTQDNTIDLKDTKNSLQGETKDDIGKGEETLEITNQVHEQGTEILSEKKDELSETSKDDHCETMEDEPSEANEDNETVAIQKNIQENGDLPNSSEMINLKLGDTPMSIDNDDQLNKEINDINQKRNDDCKLRVQDNLSQENVAEDLPKAEGTKEESHLHKTSEISESTNDLNIKGVNTEAQITNKESAVNIMEIEENSNNKTVDSTEICLESNEIKDLISSNVKCSKKDHDINKDKGDCNKSQNIDIDNEVNNSESDKDKEVGLLAEVEPNDNNLKRISRLKELLTKPSSVIKLSNTMNILSDEDDDVDNSAQDATKPLPPSSENKCINLVEDDDCMLIDEDNKAGKIDEKPLEQPTLTTEIKTEISEEKSAKAPEEAVNSTVKDDTAKEAALNEEKLAPTISEKEPLSNAENKIEKPLIPKTFLQNLKRKLSDMTRDDLEEFCVLKIAEAIIDRANLSDIKSKIKVMNQNIEEYKKKALILTRQNRDLQVVLKSVQEEQKKKTNAPITPLKITRSVGMQVVMVDKPVRRKAVSGAQAPINNAPSPSPTKILRSNVNVNNQRLSASATPPIPVPRLVPAQSLGKPVVMQCNPKPIVNTITNGAKKSPSVQQKPDKRPLSRQQTTSQSDTVDLTDDEPPAKANRTATANMPVRLVQQQSLMAPRLPNMPQTNNHRKVYIPISSSHTEGLKVGQKIMLRGVKPPDPVVMAPQVRAPPPTKIMKLPNPLPRPNLTLRHPAPLPESHKQYQPPNWRAVPPAPDLKLSKVENGIVISWKIDGYLEDKFEEIASYQLYAYQETSAAPSTLLWKKIGDVKALPLPMACTLTQFMAGYKYYFAVRAVDVKSRVGPFSMPGSILLLNKV